MSRGLSRIGIVLFALMVATAPTPAQTDAPRPTAGKGWAFDAAQEYFQHQEWDKAIRLFEEAFDDSPGDQEIQVWLLRAKGESARARAVASASVSVLLCTPDPPRESTPGGAVAGATEVQEPVTIRIEADRVLELRRARDNYLLGHEDRIAVSAAAYEWTGRGLPGGGRLLGRLSRETGRLTVRWLLTMAATDIPPIIQTFAGVCRPRTP